MADMPYLNRAWVPYTWRNSSTLSSEWGIQHLKHLHHRSWVFGSICLFAFHSAIWIHVQCSWISIYFFWWRLVLSECFLFKTGNGSVLRICKYLELRYLYRIGTGSVSVDKCVTQVNAYLCMLSSIILSASQRRKFNFKNSLNLKYEFKIHFSVKENSLSAGGKWNLFQETGKQL